jgi:tetratricopeptide (TPR) repeat protein
MGRLFCLQDRKTDVLGVKIMASTTPVLRLTMAISLIILLTTVVFPKGLKAGAGSDSTGAIAEQIKGLIVQGNLNEARNRLGEAIKKYPDEAGFYDLLGVVDAQQRDYGAAERDFKRSIQLDSKLVGAYLNLGHLYQEQMAATPAVRNKAMATYEALLKISPSNVEGNFQLALLLGRAGEFEASLRHLARLPASAKTRVQALTLLTADYSGLGKKDEAEATATKLLASRDLSSADMTPLLSVLEAHHEKDLEIRLLEGLEERNCASLPALRQLGALYASKGKLAEARSTLDKVAVRDPKPVGVLIELARIADRQKDYKGALGYLARARDLDPHDAAIHFLFGMICVQENLGKEAYKSLKKSVELKPNNPYYNYALGAVILDVENASEAIPYFNKYSQLKPGDPRGKMGMGLAYFYSHDLDSAAKILKSVEGFPRTAATAHCFLGHIAILEGNLDEAIKYSELAIKEQPDYAEAFVVLGQARMNQKQYAPAKKAFNEALHKNPNNYLANLELMILYQRMRDPRAKEQSLKVAALKKNRDLMSRRMLGTIKIVR